MAAAASCSCCLGTCDAARQITTCDDCHFIGVLKLTLQYEFSLLQVYRSLPLCSYGCITATDFCLCLSHSSFGLPEHCVFDLFVLVCVQSVHAYIRACMHMNGRVQQMHSLTCLPSTSSLTTFRARQEGIETVQTSLRRTLNIFSLIELNALVAISKGMRAVKLCSNKSSG